MLTLVVARTLARGLLLNNHIDDDNNHLYGLASAIWGMDEMIIINDNDRSAAKREPENCGAAAVDINDYTVYVTSCTNGNDKTIKCST